MSKKNITPIAAVVGAALVGGLAATDVANAADNPFGATQLESGYMLLAGTEGKCGEGKCGEGKCGEGKCGSDKETEGKCGGDKEGEGKCGGDKG
ncbi:MAG: low-complexity protein [Thiohalocapsa sp.]